MADAPSPYAPGIISEERLPPRPAGRLSVFLVATFAMTVATSGLYRFWAARAIVMAGSSIDAGIAASLVSLPGALILLWAYLSDRVGLFGTRREGYLLLASLMMAVVWIALAFGNQHHAVWMAAAVPTGLAAAVSRAAIIGALALALLIAILWDNEPSPPPPPVARFPPVTIGRFLRSRPFWASVAVVALAGAAAVPDMVLAQTRRPDEYRAFWMAAQWKTPAIIIGLAGVYLLICRRLRFDRLLLLALIAKAIGLAVHARAAHATGQTLPISALMVRAVGDGLATIALLELALRAAPRGREAFGAILLAGLGGIVTVAVGFIEIALGASVASVAWFASGAAIAAALAVSLLPPEIAKAREGRRAPEGPVLGSPS